MAVPGSATQRTPLFSRQQPGGFWNTASIDKQPGAIWFVDSTHANATDSASYGRNPDRPFATIDYAIGISGAVSGEDAGDIIYAMPNHAENIAAAGTITADIRGIKIIGLGIGDVRPTLTWTAVDATIAFDDCDILMKNFLFIQGIDAVVVMIDVNADDITLEDCEFAEAAAAQAVCFVDLDGGGANACDNFAMINCRVIQTAAGADQVVDINQVQDGVKIIGNVMDVDCENGCLYSPAIFTDILVKDNVLYNRQTGDHAIEFNTTGSGFIINNSLVGDTLGTILDPGSCFCLGNLETDAIDQCGVPTPRTAAGGAPANWIDAAAVADAAFDVAAFATDISLWQLDTATSASALTSGTIFTYTGSIEFHIIGRVTTGIQAQATTIQLTITADALAAYAICATVDANGFGAGTLLSITGTAANAMVGTTVVGSIAPGQANPVYTTCVTSGVVSTAFGAASTGVIVWELLWRPLQAGSTVTPA